MNSGDCHHENTDNKNLPRKPVILSVFDKKINVNLCDDCIEFFSLGNHIFIVKVES